MNSGPLPPGPKPRLRYSNLIGLRRDTLGFLLSMQRRYGDLVHIDLGGRDMFLINDPDVIRAILVTDHRNFHKGKGLETSKRLLGEGLLTSEGEFHRRQRRLVQPAFHRDRIVAYGELMVQHSIAHVSRWADGAIVDISEEMMRLTLGIVAKTLFDTEVHEEAEEIGAAISEAVNLMNFAMLPFAPVVERIVPTFRRRFSTARGRLDETIYRMIRERRADPRDRGDLLSMLLRSEDTGTEDGEGEDGPADDNYARAPRDESDAVVSGSQGERAGAEARMTDEQVRDEAMTIFLAGHETTANALMWTWYLLAQHPEVEAKMHAELSDVVGDRLPTVPDAPELTYTRKVFSESMRLYPPAWTIGRRILEDYPVGNYVLPAGGVCMICQYVSHRDPRWFPDPFRFDPDRWTAEAQAARPKFAYYPFGSGPRVCIGENFAWLEGVLLLAAIGRCWRMELVPGQVIRPQPIITLRSRNDIRMTLKKRPSR